MKTKLFILLILLVGCTTKNPKKNTEFQKQEIVLQKTKPDTIKTLAGFYIGMTEKEIRNYVKSNPNKFFLDNKYLMPLLRTKIDNVNYMIDFDLYKGKLHEISFSIDKGWDKIDDIKFKEHYIKIYNSLKELNVYERIFNIYSDEFKVEWPFSYGGKVIPMAEFILSDDWLHNKFIIYLAQDEDNYTYFLMIGYSGEKIENYESTLSQTLYFDE